MDISIEDIRNEIKNLINTCDLLILTPKSIRASLEDKFKTDLSERKSSIDEIIVEEIAAKKSESTADDNEPKKKENNQDNQSDDLTDTELDVNEPKAKKKKVISDEELARQIHAEESRPRRAAAPKQSGRKGKEKSSTTTGENTSIQKKSAFAKDCCLSKELAAILGKDKCPRSEVVKGMWKYFKDNNLMDPSNKQFVICDDKLLNVFGKKKFKAFGMMKDLKRHIFDEPQE